MVQRALRDAVVDPGSGSALVSAFVTTPARAICDTRMARLRSPWQDLRSTAARALTGRLVDSSIDGDFGGLEHDVSSSESMPTQQAVCVADLESPRKLWKPSSTSNSCGR